MHPSRDRLPRPIDISSLLQNAERRVDLVVDEPGLHWMGLSTHNNVSTDGASSSSSKMSRQKVGLQRIRRRRFGNRMLGKENQWPRSIRKGVGRSSILPSWYPRTPLRDITAIVRAIERKRAEICDDHTIEAPRQEADVSIPNAQIDHEKSISTLNPEACEVTDGNHGIADQKGKNIVDVFTPRKKLLNSIEKVRHIWLEDQRKLEKTPASKKAERQKRVRILMSMR